MSVSPDHILQTGFAFWSSKTLPSHILHDWDLPTKKMLLAKAWAALPPGGAVVVYDAIIDDDRKQNAFGLLMSLNIVLIPNFLHHFNIADCTRFLRRVHAALRPGGRVVIVEFVRNEDRITLPPAASFSLVMLGTTPEGVAYTFAEYQNMLTGAGFHGATLHPLPPTAESAVLATA